MEIKGVLVLKEMYAGSKSEGKGAFLISDEGKEYRLYREDVYPMNDHYFFPFEGKDILVEGEVKTEEYFLVTSIREVETQPEPEDETN